MLCGATQHSNTNPFDKTSPAIPIGPHWMIIWPNNAARDGLPNTVRDAGAWVMFDGTPYAYLHICGTPWARNEYTPTRYLCGRCGTAADRAARRAGHESKLDGVDL